MFITQQNRTMKTAIALLLLLSGCAASDPVAPEELLGSYSLATYAGQPLPVTRNPDVPALVTTGGSFTFRAGAECEYGFDVEDRTRNQRAELRYPCSYVVDGTRVSIRIGQETDFDLTGRWSETTLILRDPTGTELVYARD